MVSTKKLFLQTYESRDTEASVCLDAENHSYSEQKHNRSEPQPEGRNENKAANSARYGLIRCRLL